MVSYDYLGGGGNLIFIVVPGKDSGFAGDREKGLRGYYVAVVEMMGFIMHKFFFCLFYEFL